MNITEATKAIKAEMQGEWSHDHNVHAFEDVIVPLYALLGELVGSNSSGNVVYGEIDNGPDNEYRALLVTRDHLFYSKFRIRSEGEVGAQSAETVDGYNLEIVPRSRIRGVTVRNVEHSEYVGELTGATYTIQLDGSSVEMPIRNTYRNRTKELDLLRELTSSTT